MTASEHLCWICGASGRQPFERTRTADHLDSSSFRISDAAYGTTLPLARCEQCGFVSAESAAVAEVPHFYEQMDDPEYLESGQPRARQMEALLERALRFAPQAKTVLDVGAGSGLLVLAARRRGLQAVGVEPSRSLVAAAREQGIELLCGSLPNPALRPGQFDLIFMVDVIEHVGNPLELLRQCARLLSRDGKLLLVTPDLDSLAARVTGGKWWHFRVAHIGYFNRDTLRDIGRRAGLEIVHRFRPWWFLPLGYLLQRLGRYVPPLGALGRLERLDRVAIPFNLYDSWGVIYQREGSQ